MFGAYIVYRICIYYNHYTKYFQNLPEPLLFYFCIALLPWDGTNFMKNCRFALTSINETSLKPANSKFPRQESGKDLKNHRKLTLWRKMVGSWKTIFQTIKPSPPFPLDPVQSLRLNLATKTAFKVKIWKNQWGVVLCPCLVVSEDWGCWASRSWKKRDIHSS